MKEHSRFERFFLSEDHKWIILSADCVRSSSIILFKNTTDTYLVMAGYTQIHTCGLSTATDFDGCSHLSCCLDGNLAQSCSIL